jgi:hypothetical protein
MPSHESLPPEQPASIAADASVEEPHPSVLASSPVRSSAASLAMLTSLASCGVVSSASFALPSEPASPPNGTVHSGSLNTPTVIAEHVGNVQYHDPSVQPQLDTKGMYRPLAQSMHRVGWLHCVFEVVHATDDDTSAGQGPASIGP